MSALLRSVGCSLVALGCSSDHHAYVPPAASPEGVVCNAPVPRSSEVVVDDMSLGGFTLPLDLSALPGSDPGRHGVGAWAFTVDASGSGKAIFPTGSPLTRPPPSDLCPDKYYIHVVGVAGKYFGASVSFSFLAGKTLDASDLGGGSGGTGGNGAVTDSGGSASAVGVGGSLGNGGGGAGGAAVPLGSYVTFPFDASAFKGVSLYLRSSNGARVRVAFPSSDTVPEGGVCNKASASGCYNDFGVDISGVSTEWTRYDIDFAKTQQTYGWGLAIPGGLKTTQLHGVTISFFPDLPFDLWIDRVVLVRK